MPNLIKTIAKHFVVIRCLPALEQFRKGLNEFSLIDLGKKSPKVFQQLFTGNLKEEIKSAHLRDLLTIKYSPIGSNRREKETAVMVHLYNFIDEMDGKIFINIYLTSFFTPSL